MRKSLVALLLYANRSASLAKLCCHHILSEAASLGSTALWYKCSSCAGGSFSESLGPQTPKGAEATATWTSQTRNVLCVHSNDCSPLKSKVRLFF